MKEQIEQAKILLDALPYIQKYKDEVFIIKYGGSAQIDPDLKSKFARDIILLYLVGIKPVIVHGGGKKINAILDKLKIKSEFVDGLRVTTKEIMEVVEMVLCGNINKEIINLLNMHGGKALGITGKDGKFMTARSKSNGKYGLVGEIENINNSVLDNLLNEKFIPVIAPIASGDELGHPGYNINADLAASKIAASIKAKKVIFLTDTKGVLDKEKKLLSTLTKKQIVELKKDKTIIGGMIPKVDACLEAVEAGVEKAHIIDGRIEHSLLLEIFTSDGIGTVIKND